MYLPVQLLNIYLCNKNYSCVQWLLQNIISLCITFQIHKFLQWVKAIYSDLPNHLPKIFEPKPSIKVKDLSEVNIDQLLQETYTTTPIHTEKKLLDGSVVTVSKDSMIFRCLDCLYCDFLSLFFLDVPLLCMGSHACEQFSPSPFWWYRFTCL